VTRRSACPKYFGARFNLEKSARFKSRSFADRRFAVSSVSRKATHAHTQLHFAKFAKFDSPLYSRPSSPPRIPVSPPPPFSSLSLSVRCDTAALPESRRSAF